MSGIRYAFKKQKATQFLRSYLGKVSRKRAWKILLPQQTRGWLIGAKRITHPYANVNQYEAPPLATTARSYWFIDLHDPRTSAYEIEVKSNSKSRIYLTTTACKMAIIRELTLAHGALNDKIGSRSLHIYYTHWNMADTNHSTLKMNLCIKEESITCIGRQKEKREENQTVMYTNYYAYLFSVLILLFLVCFCLPLIQLLSLTGVKLIYFFLISYCTLK